MKTLRSGTGGARLCYTVILVVLTLSVVSAPVAAHGGDDGAHHHDGWMGTHDGMGGWFGGGLGFLWLILGAFVVVIIPTVVIYLLFVRTDRAGESTEDALEVLRRRYA
jgi:putative membrane protein